jgi:hypothetical protein
MKWNELKPMTNTESHYVYTLNDVYKIFQQTECHSEKFQLLTEWHSMNLPYLINWETLLILWDPDSTRLNQMLQSDPNGRGTNLVYDLWGNVTVKK